MFRFKSSLIVLVAMITVCIVGSTKACADSLKVRELGFQFSVPNTTNSGLQYKFGVGKSNMIRMTFYNVRYEFVESNPVNASYFGSSTTTASISGSLGIEKRKILNEFVQFYNGINLIGGQYWRRYYLDDPTLPSKQRYTDEISSKLGISLHLGIQTALRENLYVGVEIEPSLLWIYTKDNISNIPGSEATESRYISGGITNTSLKVLMTYKWNKSEE